MRRIVCGGLAALTLTALMGTAAFAKGPPGEEKVRLTPTMAAAPPGISGGESWNATINFPPDQAAFLPEELRLYVRIKHATSGAEKVFSAGRAARGEYLASVVFPSGGAWSVEVLTPWDAWAITNVSVAAPTPVGSARGVPAVPVGVAAAALIALASVAILHRMRRARTVPVLR